MGLKRGTGKLFLVMIMAIIITGCSSNNDVNTTASDPNRASNKGGHWSLPAYPTLRIWISSSCPRLTPLASLTIKSMKVLYNGMRIVRYSQC